ncbi:MAG: hypothetical protein L6Q75_19635 [Burkholderiaceae bacterium]|nr:hypothetical protein [Burkholderiaceae bacterium]
MSRRARTRAGARPWAQPTADGPDVEALLAQAKRFPAPEPTQPAKPQGPARLQDRRRVRER